MEWVGRMGGAEATTAVEFGGPPQKADRAMQALGDAGAGAVCWTRRGLRQRWSQACCPPSPRAHPPPPLPRAHSPRAVAPLHLPAVGAVGVLEGVAVGQAGRQLLHGHAKLDERAQACVPRIALNVGLALRTGGIPVVGMN